MQRESLNLNNIFPLDLSPEEKMLQDIVLKFSETELGGEVAKQMDKDCTTPSTIIKKIKELGLLKIVLPEEYGGFGGTLTAYLVAMEAMCKYNPAVALLAAVNNSLVIPPIRDYASEYLKDRYLAGIGDGAIGAYGLTEPESGSDSFALKTKAEKKGDEFILNGRKIYITNGSQADFIVVFARTGEPDSGHKGVSAFIVEKEYPGFSVGKDEDKMGIRGSFTSALYFEDCVVPASNLIGREGEGARIAMNVLNGGRMGIGAQVIGIMAAMIEACHNHGTIRNQFGVPIISQQLMYGPLTEYLSDWELIRSYMYSLARRRESKTISDKEFAMRASMIKLRAADVGQQLGLHAIRLHGGEGYMRECPVERYLRDMIITGIYEGTREMQQITIAKHMGWVGK